MENTTRNEPMMKSYLICDWKVLCVASFRAPDSEFLFIEMGTLKFYDWLIDWLATDRNGFSTGFQIRLNLEWSLERYVG